MSEDVNSLEKTIKDKIPDIIRNSNSIKNELDSKIAEQLTQTNNPLPGQDPDQALQLIKMQCLQNSSAISGEFSFVCDDFKNGKINSKEDIRNSLIENKIIPSVQKGIDLSELRTATSEFSNYQGILLLVFIVLVIFGIFMLFLATFNIARTINGFFWYVMFDSLFFLLPLLLPFIFGANLENLFADQVTHSITLNETSKSIVTDIVRPIITIFIDWFKSILLRLVSIFSLIFLVSLVIWYFTRVRNQTNQK